MKILHVITGLDSGGAERSLYNLLKHYPDSSHEHAVCSLHGLGKYGPLIQSLGIPVFAADGNARPIFIPQVARRTRPDIVQGWMHHGDLAAWWARAFMQRPRPALLWNVRQTVYDLALEKRQTALAIRIAAHLSSAPDRIIYNSRIGANQHEKIGFRADKTIVIPNGFDTDLFHPDPVARARLRNKLGIGETTAVIGLIGRLHPMKDHEGFLMAARRLARVRSDCIFLLAGSGTDGPGLKGKISSLGLSRKVLTLGEQQDIPAVNAALDVAVLSSFFGEGFPNVIGEAMACAVPCVVTDVGDAAAIVADTGLVVPRRDPEALADALDSLLGRPDRVELGRRARRRVEQYFSISTAVGLYHGLYQKCGSDHVRN